MELAAAASQPAPGERAGRGSSLEARIWYATLLTRVRGLRPAGRLVAAATSAPHAPHRPEVQAALHLCQAEIHLAGGRPAEAAAAAEAGLRLAGQAGSRGLPPRGHVVMAVCSVRSLDLTTGLLYANYLRDAGLLGQENLMPGQCVWAAAQALEARNGLESVAHLLKGIAYDDVLAGDLLVSQPAAASWLVRAGQRLGDDDLAEGTVRRMSGIALANPSFRSVQAAAEHAAALYERDADALETAAERHLDPWARASALEDASRIRSARVSERDRAVGLLRRAADAYLGAGASRDLSRVQSRIRELDGQCGRPARGRTRVSRLTDTEFAVAELVSQGLTNGRVGSQLYISPHTVAFHLKKIFRKLDVTSRVELARSWNRILVEERADSPRESEPGFKIRPPMARQAV
ncbi:LuxR family transcriptional regulator [Streptomyces dangxiongensis]|uniref:LuxR family transcriptional regulator n=1 Tax=Streptomyces dangxiongensis TaxID=1442032 RepID=A0A3G2J7P6_9ACTN|nr:LuxR C-terminal-related transcriptional regulator [Streptomyces dangxiongensis]AYN38266.1 LuxR family transcriptional regulator [Streptomyces dangxiongensis]